MVTAGDPSQRHFEAARRKAFWNRVRRIWTRRPRKLLSWQKLADDLHLQDFGDVQVAAVSLRRIVGSVGRYTEFDHAFMPKLDSSSVRWRSVARAYLTGLSLPPVTLYKLGDAHFVIDGHHRVSVARELGRQYIDALVIEAKSRVPLPTDLDVGDVQIAAEYTRFLEATRLDSLRPDQNIRFTTVGAYCWALKHIALHRQAMRRQQGRLSRRDQAVADWYDHVYLPTVRLIREESLLAEFPHRTEADLFLWIVDHQRHLSSQCRLSVSARSAAQRLARDHAAGPLEHLLRAAREWIAGPNCPSLPDPAPHPRNKE